MRRLILLLSFIVATAADVRAQQPVDEGWTAVPSIGFGWLGRRWSGGDPGNEVELGPGPFPQLTLGLQNRTAGKLTFELQAGFTPTDFGADADIDSVASRFVGVGKVNLVRVQGGVLYRLRPDVPGYFSAGAGAVYVHVVEPFAGWEQESELAPSAHFGAGYDARAGSTAFRFDARVHLTRGMKTVSSIFGPLEPRFATDLIFSVGYLIGL